MIERFDCNLLHRPCSLAIFSNLYLHILTFFIMADPQVHIAIGDEDVDMQGDDAHAIDEVPETGVSPEDEAAAAVEEVSEDKNAPKLTFAE